ncbi:MAG: hypothetical protein HRU15_01510 [Planctomycetes bacterium]|nr:hypothetical protein [Planctomycetota bacterium]
MFRCIMITCIAALCFSNIYGADYVWVEGEDMVKGTLHDKHHNVSRHKKLSGGVSFGSNELPQKGEWNVDMPEAGTWHVYVRKFWKHGPFKWTVNGSNEKELTKAGTLLLDGTGLDVRHQNINWVYLGTNEFTKGSNTLAVAGTSEKKGAFVIDCFVITKRPFTPSGLKKPGEKLGLTTLGKWPFEPDYDEYRADALGLRDLNEKVAGENGYVSMNDKGDFLDGKGKIIRFWCTQGGLHNKPGTDQVVRHAKHLAKRGINMYRHHGHLNPDPSENPMNTRKSQIDGIQKMVAIMKKEGIYSTVSPFWATHSTGGKDWVPGFKGGKLTGLVFWNEDFKKIYKKWWKDLLLVPNPYDDNKTPLAEDSALAIIQLQNEDSLLFWTVKYIQQSQPTHYQQLEKLFHAWIEKKGLPKTPFKIDLWQAINHPNKNHNRAVQFLTETMYQFNSEMDEFFRKEIKCKSLINAGNWKTASAEKMLDLERWSYTANEVIGVNRYVNGQGKAGKKPQPLVTK